MVLHSHQYGVLGEKNMIYSETRDTWEGGSSQCFGWSQMTSGPAIDQRHDFDGGRWQYDTLSCNNSMYSYSSRG